MRILFIHEGFGQFQTLHQHLNASGLAESWFLCSTGVHDANKDRVPNLVPFRMVAENPKSYFYTRGLEARTQRSFLLREAMIGIFKHALTAAEVAALAALLAVVGAFRVGAARLLPEEGSGR